MKAKSTFDFEISFRRLFDECKNQITKEAMENTQKTKVKLHSNTSEVYITDKQKIDHAVENTVESVLKFILLNPNSEVSLKKRITVVREIVLNEKEIAALPSIRQGFFDATIKIRNLLSDIK